ncbi:MAG: 30S ribosomal protein S7 [Candidatus Magasanikbacteria bacterium GW2011_GWA2_46_17]|uniref:Small ribosomal subunit protein uS7 n=1 Tax=Candidatus Magasanikbacteria bacterium GW2011_GWA2_46_17 TaxID=1619042 RepID=A0A0G1RBH3_9BACT|nr:MAG: 30S ribosomal protein S7 [Candidatus Magasanikbacteria bacterium GW2011_GWA2_46_17]
MPKREIAPDPKYGNVTLAKFINYVMKGGKKSVAQSVVYGALLKIADISKKDPLKVFEEAIKNVQPQVEVRSRRVGGSNYQVPLPVSGVRQNALAFRWIIGAARAKKGQSMADRLATVLNDASQGMGDAMKKRDDVHRMAEANKAFAHFARFLR